MRRWPNAVACLALITFGLMRAAPDRVAEAPGHPVSAAVTGAMSPGATGPFAATVIRVIDGDTFEARLSVWLDVEIVTRVRLAGIDAPELHARCAEERDRARAAREVLSRLLEDGPVRLSAVRRDKFGGRIDATVTDGRGRDVSRAMLEAGLAVPYHGGRRIDPCPGRS